MTKDQIKIEEQDWDTMEEVQSAPPTSPNEQASTSTPPHSAEENDNPYTRLHFDTLIVTGMVFTKCESGNECHKHMDKPMCKACLSRNHYVMFAYMQPHDFEYVVPPNLFTQLYPMYTMKGVSTMEVVSLMMAGVDYLDKLFNPDHPFAEIGEEWKKRAASVRQRAKDIWLSDYEKFVQGLRDSTSMTELIRILERRLVTGQGICHFVKGKKPGDEWKQWVEKQLDLNQTQVLVPWTFERCKADRVNDSVEAVKLCNQFKRNLLKRENE